MPIDQRLAADAAEIAEWRRHLHRRPELLYDVHETAAFVAEKLRGFGCDEIVEGIGRTGVVALIHGVDGPGGPAVALRADMDALPVTEETGAPHASLHPGRMHACGHDGHTAMLLGAARHLARTRRFRGTVALVFQPAEEGGAGALAMIRDGLLERFAIREVYGMHNLPGLGVGRFAIRPGPIMAATDEFAVTIRGRGGHAAMPHRAIDPILAGAALVQALQQIAARNAGPLEAVVVSVTEFHAGFAHNVIPDSARISGTLRSLTPAMRGLAERRIREIAGGIAAAHGAAAEIDWDANYPVTLNHPAAAAFCATVAAQTVGEAQVDDAAEPLLAGEDFSYMLERRPGAFIFIGNGESASLHHAAYDFDDRAIPYGCAYWVRLAERALGTGANCEPAEM